MKVKEETVMSAGPVLSQIKPLLKCSKM